MKTFHILLLLFSLCFSEILSAQNTFEIILSYPEDQKINHLIEDDNGNFVMTGRIKNNETLLYKGYLIKIDSSGNLIQEYTFGSNDSISYNLFNIHFSDNYYYILGAEMVESPEITRLWYLKLNSNLEIINEKLLSIPNGKWFSYMNSIIDSDTNIVITGYTTRIDETNNYNNDAFFYKLNIDGDSLKSKFYTSSVPLHFSFDIIEKNDNSSYFAFVSHFTNIFGTSGQRVTLDKNLDSLAIDSIPNRVYDFYSPIYINQNDLLLCAKRGEQPPNDYALNVLSITDNCQLTDYNTFKKSTFRDHPAMYNGVSKNADNIYVGGTSNFDYYNPFYSSLDSWYHLVKINPDITPIWEYWYGGDAYYHLYSISATNDGGCIMVGNRYDDDTQYQERDIYILKVNEEGLLMNISENPGVVLHEALVFPNPGNNYLKVRLAVQVKQCTIELYDMNGKLLLSDQIQGLWGEMNTSALIPGTYIYRIYNDEGLFESGKWVKQ